MTADGGLLIGIDIGGTKTHAVALTRDGKVSSEVTEATVGGAAGLLEGIRRAVDELTRAGGARVDSIGIGIPGVVDVSEGVVRQALNLGIEHWHMSADVANAVGVTPRIDNDVNAAALGARQLLGISGSMAYLNLGTGVAAGLVIDGAIARGSSGLAGEVGHVVVDPAGPLCDCGQSGCIEAMAGGRALARIFPDHANPVAAMFAGADSGDSRSIDALDRFVYGVVSAIRVILLSVDVERVVVGGGVTAHGPLVERHVRAGIERAESGSPFLTSIRMGERISFLPSSLRAPAIGAALLGSAS